MSYPSLPPSLPPLLSWPSLLYFRVCWGGLPAGVRVLWRRALLLRVSLGLSCLGFAGFVGFSWSHFNFFMVSAGSA